MMSERDELAEEISGHPIGGGYYATQVGMAEAREIADAILAAGYRKPRTITTVEELDTLPVRSVILAANGEPFIAHNYDRRDGKKKLWSTGGATAGAFDSEWFTKPLIGAGLPATVLREPEATK